MIALPPYAATLGITLAWEDGAPVLVLPFSPGVVGRPGFVHGGAIGGLLEMAAIAALLHALGEAPGVRVKPINVTVHYMRGGRDKPTRASGQVTRLGARIANVTATAWQDDAERPIATARTSYRIVR